MPRGVYKRTEEMYTPERNKKISLALKGKSFPNRTGMLGKHHSEETKEKLRIAKSGGKLTEEHKNKISQSLKGRMPKNAVNWWKGGITPINKARRVKREYKLWRKAIFERDDFTCQKTGVRGGILRAHHINNFADFPELRLAIDNGITLSEKAHKEFHKIYGIKNNTREQLEEFLNND